MVHHHYRRYDTDISIKLIELIYMCTLTWKWEKNSIQFYILEGNSLMSDQRINVILEHTWGAHTTPHYMLIFVIFIQFYWIYGAYSVCMNMCGLVFNLKCKHYTYCMLVYVIGLVVASQKSSWKHEYLW